MSNKTVINNNTLCKIVAEKLGKTIVEVKSVLDTYQDLLKEHLEQENTEVRLKGIGTLYKKPAYQRYFNPLGKGEAGIYTVEARYKLRHKPKKQK